MLHISPQLSLAEHELEITGLRAAGPGGQHGDKAETAIHLRFDIHASSLPDTCKQRLLALRDRRISRDGIVVIKAQEHRSREQNIASARERLCELLRAAMARPTVRRPTRPSRRARRQRTDAKRQRGRLKALRKPPED